MIHRRSFVTGLISLIAAPAIVRASSLMPVKLVDFNPQTLFIGTIDDGVLRIGDTVYVSEILQGTIVRQLTANSFAIKLETYDASVYDLRNVIREPSTPQRRLT